MSQSTITNEGESRASLCLAGNRLSWTRGNCQLNQTLNNSGISSTSILVPTKYNFESEEDGVFWGELTTTERISMAKANYARTLRRRSSGVSSTVFPSRRSSLTSRQLVHSQCLPKPAQTSRLSSKLTVTPTLSTAPRLGPKRNNGPKGTTTTTWQCHTPVWKIQPLAMSTPFRT